MNDKTYKEVTLTQWAAYFKYKKTEHWGFLTNIYTKKYE